MNKRPWYRLHWVTWVVLLIVGWAIGWCQVDDTRQTQFNRSGFVSAYFASHGWPFKALVERYSLWGIRTFDVELVNSVALALDVALSFILLGSTALVSERWIRGPKRLQLQLKTLLSVTAVVALSVLLVTQRETTWWWRLRNELDLVRNYQVVIPEVSSDPSLGPLHLQPWYVRFPVIFAIGCTIYLAADLATRLASRCFKLVRRSRRK